MAAHRNGGVERHGHGWGDAALIFTLGRVVRSLEHVEHFLRDYESACDYVRKEREEESQTPAAELPPAYLISCQPCRSVAPDLNSLHMC